MLDGIDYTEEDAEFDSQLVFREIEDLDPSTWMGNALIGKHGTEQESQFRKTIQTHLKNIRFSKFALQAIKSEIHNCQQCEGKATTENVSTETPGTNSYRQHLGACNRIAVVKIPDVDQMISDAGSVRVEASMKQMKKDIERDRLLINGVRIVGAELGLDTVLQKMCDMCDQIHTECGIPTLGNEVKQFAVLSLLSKASRSHSGGIAFQAVQSLIDPSVAMLVPQSAVTPPLKINIHLGAFPSSSGTLVSSNTSHTVSTTTGSCISITDMPCSPADAGTNTSRGGDQQVASRSLQSVEASAHVGGEQRVPAGKCRWGLIGKVSCESIFKIQLFDAPEEVGYDDCSTGELEHEQGQEQWADEAPCLFRPVLPSESGRESFEGCSGTGDTQQVTSAENHQITQTGAEGAQRDARYPGITIGSHNTFVSVVYEDYVLFEVKLAPAGELSNFENLVDNWKETASVTITEIVPVRTLI